MSLGKITISLLIISIITAVSNSYAITIEEIIEQLDTKRSKISDISVIESCTSKSTISTFSLKIKCYIKGDKWRIDEIHEGGDSFSKALDSITFYDGKSVKVTSPMVRTITMPDILESDYDSVMENLPVWLRDWKKIFSGKAEVVGEEMIGDRKAIQIDYTMYNIDKNSIWIEPGKVNILKIKTEDSTSSFFDFKDVEGYGEVPYKNIVSSDTGDLSSETIKTIESIAINQGVSDALFDMDKVETEMKKKSTEFSGSLQKAAEIEDFNDEEDLSLPEEIKMPKFEDTITQKPKEAKVDKQVIESDIKKNKPEYMTQDPDIRFEGNTVIIIGSVPYEKRYFVSEPSFFYLRDLPYFKTFGLKEMKKIGESAYFEIVCELSEDIQ